MTTYDWDTVRQRATELFHDPPGPIEADIVEAFKADPSRVVATIEQVGLDYAAGRIERGWPILRSRLKRDETHVVVSDDAAEKRRAIVWAERHITNALCWLDRESELVDELFGDRGRLRAWPELEQQMIERWQAERPKAEARQAADDKFASSHQPKPAPVPEVVLVQPDDSFLAALAELDRHNAAKGNR